MSRILVLMDHKENRRLLAEWLATRYTVLPADTDQAVDEHYDLCILDGTTLDRLADRIQARKEAPAAGVPPLPSRDRRAAGRLGDAALVEEH